MPRLTGEHSCPSVRDGTPTQLPRPLSGQRSSRGRGVKAGIERDGDAGGVGQGMQGAPISQFVPLSGAQQAQRPRVCKKAH